MTASASRRRIYTPALLVLLGLAAGGCTSAAGDPLGAGDVGLLQEAMRQVERSYVAPVRSDQLVTGALKGMLSRLDPHSDYMTDREFRELIATTSGQFGGIGIEVSVENGIPQVVAAIEGTPAAAAGIEPGDRIVKADGQPIIGLEISEVVRRLRGAPGTPVVLTIARANRQAFDVPITRAVVHVESVKPSLKPGRIGYVRITTFNENTPGALRLALTRLRQQAGGTLAGLAIDLRNDAGGLLESAVEAAGQLLDSGTIVTTRGRRPDENRVYQAPPNGDLVRGTPVVVLINGASASAAEIFAGALQDNRRATIIGTQSFGKGSVQSIIPLEGRGALRLTTALYYTPSGRAIQGEGIVPDQIVTLPKEAQVANAVTAHESDLVGALKAPGGLGRGSGPDLPPRTRRVTRENEHPINPKVIGTAQDTQLNHALSLLGGRAR